MSSRPMLGLIIFLKMGKVLSWETVSIKITIFPKLIYEFKIILIRISSEGKGLENGSKDHLEE